jgi:hypothetical protein
MNKISHSFENDKGVIIENAYLSRLLKYVLYFSTCVVFFNIALI